MIRYLASGIALLLAGCSFGDEAVSDRERQIGAQQHPQLLAQFGGRYAGDEADYLKQLGDKMAAGADLQGQCTFTLINSDVVNAFAVPGCYIYVTRGLMAIVNSEAELASVLAHELGHIAANHSERQQRQSLFRGFGVAALGAATGSERLSRLASAAATLFTLRYSRKHEYEADDLGIDYLRKTGYDPRAAVGMLGALGRHQQFLTSTRGRDQANSMPEWSLTHPLTESRIARSLAAANAAGVAPDGRDGNSAVYLRTLDNMLYGDDPAQGFVMGRRFAHPVMRIAFEAPAGFTLSNTPQAILLEGPDGLQGEFAGGPVPAGGLAAYAEQTLARMLGKAPAELGPAVQSTTNGVPTIIVPGTARTPQGSVNFSFAAYQGPRGDAFHFILISKPGASATSATETLFKSFRMLSATEAASLRPRRIRTVRVGPGVSLSSAASQMATDHPIESFMMLNGRSAGQPLKPGELVKTVVLSAQ